MLLDVKNLSVAYPDGTVALDGVSFSLQKGSILAVVGESGSGKSTLALSMLGLLPKGAMVRGEMCFENKNVMLDMLPYFERIRAVRIGLVMQDPAACFNPVLSLGYHFHELLRIKGGVTDAQAREERIFAALKQVNLAPSKKMLDMYPHQFSGGQLQRAAIALAIVLRPQLLIADEPTSSLDVVVESGIINLFKDLRRELGLTMIFITHNLALANVLADNLLVMRSGVVREYGLCSTVFNDPKDSYTKELLAAYQVLE